MGSVHASRPVGPRAAPGCRFRGHLRGPVQRRWRRATSLHHLERRRRLQDLFAQFGGAQGRRPVGHRRRIGGQGGYGGYQAPPLEGARTSTRPPPPLRSAYRGTTVAAPGNGQHDHGASRRA
ncbi:hypothetical protein QJS66_18055 [Kocuria rhizophila]|nr:hypothetical protein QJS66_18055 [Kocuria rhizophila]